MITVRLSLINTDKLAARIQHNKQIKVKVNTSSTYMYSVPVYAHRIHLYKVYYINCEGISTLSISIYSI